MNSKGPHHNWIIIVLSFISYYLHTQPSNAFSVHLARSRNVSIKKYRNRSSLNLSESNPIGEKTVYLEGIASAGLTNEEIPHILSVTREALADEFGIEFRTDNMIHENDPAIPDMVPGATGRVLLITLNNVASDWEVDDERLDPFKNIISQRIDSIVGSEIEQPVLVSVRPNYIRNGESLSQVLSDIVHKEAITYDLCRPIISKKIIGKDQILPTIQVEIDGAMIYDYYTQEEVWDTSSVMVFDDFVDNSLRERLLDVVNGRDEEYSWNDKTHGPDPKRWIRGGLMDTLNDNEDVPTCWGLSEEATHELCFEEHSAIAEVEEKISNLFPDFTVTRLPEACFGSCVSPLTANAPTFGDVFAYHIDADPNQMPPSPWTDLFGRYFNRVRGKPRFVSCLLYLNDEWDEELGAPTQFYDPPTEEIYEIHPKPGRCVIMDQDITHSVVAPNENAGANPRYSLVWKLILHPKEEKQCMKFPTSKSLVKIGSASVVQ
mmetsp:Transcript_23167/g.34491  ORF Transcript_23167/g.34491 Transcript_23167/m.34491 type:complete len:490 (+) Transcript_23167:56-1525(+)